MSVLMEINMQDQGFSATGLQLVANQVTHELEKLVDALRGLTK